MAKSLTLKQRIGLKILKHRIKRALRGYRKEFKNIMDYNGVTSDHKLLLFIVYFIQQITHSNIKPAKILEELDEKGVVGSYARLYTKIENHEPSHGDSPKKIADDFASTLIKFIGEKKSDLDKGKLSALIFHIIELIQLTDNAPQFDISATKNLASNYEEKVNTAINVTKAIADVQNLLIETLPEASNDLIVIVNNLIRKLFK
jgi:hypothetical protein